MKTSIFSFVVVGLLVVIGGLIVLSAGSQETTPVNFDGSVDASQVATEVNAGESRLLDVRTLPEYDLDHAVGAEQFNVERLKDGELPNIDKDERIYLYCRSGNRSAQAKDILDANGFTNVVDLGGFNTWIEGGGQTAQTQLDNYLDILETIGRQPIEALGPEDADLTIVKYSDFACPFCAKYTLETELLIRENYVDDPTKSVRYEFRNYAYLGDESAIAAVAGYCANEQALFWPFHDNITLGYGQQGPDFLTNENFVQTIGQLGGNSQDFEICINSGLYDSVVSAEAIDAESSGLSSTPTVIVGDQEVNGALPYATYKAAIDARLQ